jgi:hypothetical protein
MTSLSERDLVRYQAQWDTALGRLQRAHPARWSVRGWSPEEVRAELTLRLIEVLLEDPEREGEDWPLVVMRERLNELRRVHRLDATPMEFDDAPLVPRESTPEEDCLDAEEETAFALARDRAVSGLTVPQRRWFAAMRMAANGGAFFRASQALNLSEASRVLGKNRSSAQRAFRELQEVFVRELDPAFRR